jgi:hypothetical protein
MPNDRSTRQDFLAAAEHIRNLMRIVDRIDDLIPCGWLSSEQASLLKMVREFTTACVRGERPLTRALRHTINSLLTIFDEEMAHGMAWDNQRITDACEVLERSEPAPDRQKLDSAVGHIRTLLDIIRGVDEGDECEQVVLNSEDEIVEAMHFVQAHAKPEPTEEQPYTIVGFKNFDEVTDYLKQLQNPEEPSDYGDDEGEWIVP